MICCLLWPELNELSIFDAGAIAPRGRSQADIPATVERRTWIKLGAVVQAKHLSYPGKYWEVLV